MRPPVPPPPHARPATCCQNNTARVHRHGQDEHQHPHHFHLLTAQGETRSRRRWGYNVRRVSDRQHQDRFPTDVSQLQKIWRMHGQLRVPERRYGCGAVVLWCCDLRVCAADGGRQAADCPVAPALQRAAHAAGALRVRALQCNAAHPTTWNLGAHTVTAVAIAIVAVLLQPRNHATTQPRNHGAARRD